MNTVGVIQARMGSGRLPGKVLMEILGKPILELLIERIRHSRKINLIAVATTTSEKDEAIVRLCDRLEVGVFRGSEADVLSRVSSAFRAFKADVGVEFMADNPIPEPALIDKAITLFKLNNYDLLTNSVKTTFTPGLELWIFRPQLLYDAERFAVDRDEREHIFLHITKRPEKYRIYNLEASEDYNYPQLHLELDTEEDFEVIKRIYENFYPKNKNFSAKEAIRYLRDNPEIGNINKGVFRRWKKIRESL